MPWLLLLLSPTLLVPGLDDFFTVVVHHAKEEKSWKKAADLHQEMQKKENESFPSHQVLSCAQNPCSFVLALQFSHGASKDAQLEVSEKRAKNEPIQMEKRVVLLQTIQ